MIILLSGMPRINHDTRVEIVELSKNGESQRSISKRLHVSRCAIQAILKKFNSAGAVADLPKSGRIPKTSIREQRNLIRFSKRNPFLPATTLRRNWNTQNSVSISTVKYILRKYGLLGRIAARKPLLNKKQIHRRLCWCRKHFKWNHKNWKKVIFSDECRLELVPKARHYVRRERCCRFKHQYTQKTIHSGRRSLMIWGAIKANGERQLVRCIQTVNAAEYMRILNCGLNKFYKKDEILVQDNAPCHNARATRAFLASKKIKTMDNWPAQSPDLNIIENLWSLLKNKVACMPANNVDELWENCCRVWKSIPNETIRKLYESINTRILEVIRNKGLNSRY